MKYVSIVAIVVCGLASACSIKSEKTVVERPAPASPVVYSEAAPSSTTVYVPVR
jgi:hypothetical protein